MILYMSEAFEFFLQEATIKTVTSTSTNFVVTDVIVGRLQQCVIQSASPDDLKADTIDHSNEHLTVHSSTVMLNGEYLQYKGKDYKFIGKGDFTDYGFCKQLAEETKRPLLVIT